MDSAGFSIEDQPLPGVYVFNMPRYDDNRGIFLKTSYAKAFGSLGIPFESAEQSSVISNHNSSHLQINLLTI